MKQRKNPAYAMSIGIFQKDVALQTAIMLLLVLFCRLQHGPCNTIYLHASNRDAIDVTRLSLDKLQLLEQ
jgi:hypothetical protein